MGYWTIMNKTDVSSSYREWGVLVACALLCYYMSGIVNIIFSFLAIFIIGCGVLCFVYPDLFQALLLLFISMIETLLRIKPDDDYCGGVGLWC